MRYLIANLTVTVTTWIYLRREKRRRDEAGMEIGKMKLTRGNGNVMSILSGGLAHGGLYEKRSCDS